MGVPLSVRLDDHVREQLEALARERGVGLSTYIRDLATEAARQAFRARVREQSAALARHIATCPEAREFIEDWGTPTTQIP